MFHLLTTVTETGAFLSHRRPIIETGRGVGEAAASLEVSKRRLESANARSFPSGTAGPAHASLWHKPILCCGLFSMALMIGSITVERASAQDVATPTTRAAKVANALTAGPEEITRNATVRDWPRREGEAPALLRQGTNAWICMPDDPTTPGNDPTCMDETFFSAVASFFGGPPAKVTRVGYAYMLTSDAEGSNTDPTAQARTATNQWHHAGPHVMLLYPDPRMLDGLPTKPTAEGPYVMFPGTPIAHVMFPVASGYGHAGTHSASSQRTGKRR